MAQNQPNETDRDAADTVAEVANESVLVTAARVGMMVLGLGATFLLGRYYGPETLGRYSLVRTVVYVATLVTVFGFQHALAKFVPRFRNKGERDKLLVLTRTAATYTSVLGLVGAIGLLLGNRWLAEGVFHDPGMAEPIWWGAAILLPFTAVRVFSGLYRGVKSYGLYALVSQAGLRMMLVIGLGLAWAVGWNDARGALGAYLVAVTVVFIWCVWYSRNFALDFSPLLLDDSEKGRRLQREVLGFSSTMIFVAAMNFLMRKVDILMAGVFLDSSQVGIYRIAATISVFVAFFLQASNAVFSPLISEFFDDERHELLQRTYSSITKWIVLFTLPVVVSFGMFPEQILGLFGSAYVDGALALQILTAGTFVSVAVGATGYLLIMGGYERLQLVNNATVAALNVGLNWWLIPLFGISGAALATAISMIVIAVVRVCELYLLNGLFPYDATFLPIPLATAGMVAVALLARPIVGNVPMVLVVTTVNLALGLGLMYWFRTDLDGRLFGRARRKIESILPGR